MREQDKLKVVLTSQDLKDLNITYEEINYDSQNTKKVIMYILMQAKTITGFDSSGKLLLIEIFPEENDGCIIYFSSIKNNEKRDQKFSKNFKKISKELFGSYLFEYNDIEDLIKSSVLLFKLHGHKIYKSSLYKNEENNKHYLSITTIDPQNEHIMLLMKEFSEMKNKGLLHQLSIDEHSDIIIKDNALEILYKYFSDTFS